MIQQDSSCSSMGACSTRIEIALRSRKQARDLTGEVLTASWKWYFAAYAGLKRFLTVMLHSCSCYKGYGICIYTCVTGVEKMAGQYESRRAKSARRKEPAGILDCMTRYSL